MFTRLAAPPGRQAPTQCLTRHRHFYMNAIVLVALRRPLTFVVMSILIILFGTMAVLKTPTDIFPAIRIPVIAVKARS
jgi:hypothetical protein